MDLGRSNLVVQGSVAPSNKFKLYWKQNWQLEIPQLIFTFKI